jgi:ADP-ribosylglycohydrolase
MKNGLFTKIYGSLAGLAIGDALGFPVHDLAKEEIRKRYGGLVDRFLPAFPDDFIHIDYKAGQITDDTILTLVTADILIKTNGLPTLADVVKSLGDWAKKNEPVWSRGEVFGDTTKASFKYLVDCASKGDKWEADLTRGYATVGSSNGAVMRIAPAGMANPGKPEKASEIVFPLIFPTHRTDVAISAACGQASAVAEALREGSTINTIAQAAIKGADYGDKLGKEKAYVIPSASVARRIEFAVELADRKSDPLEAAYLIEDMIGSYLPAAETLPAAIGVFYACKGDPMLSIKIAVSMGGDTDTVASAAGAIAGAYRGIDAISHEMLDFIEEVNGLKLEQYARDLTDLTES